MGMVAFFPWLKVLERIQVGTFRLFHHHWGAELPEPVTSTVLQEDLQRLLSPYRVHVRGAESAHCLVQYADVPIGSDLGPSERAAVFRFARHLAVAGLATRRFDGSPLGRYSASGHYQVIIQQFPTPFTGSVVSSHRRKDGETRVLTSPGALDFKIPEHLVGQAQPQIDRPLLDALEAAHGALDVQAWGPYEASITQFLMANSDSSDVPQDAESIATFAALERLVDAGQDLKDFTRKLLDCLATVDGTTWAQELRQNLMPNRKPRDVVDAWLKGLYVLRGNAGHGYPASKLKSVAWAQPEHLLAGAFVYPLALKCRLQQAGFYQLTTEDVTYLVGLDLLLNDRPFFVRSTVDGADDGAAQSRGWPRQMAALGKALAVHELRCWTGDAGVETVNQGKPDEATDR